MWQARKVILRVKPSSTPYNCPCIFNANSTHWLSVWSVCTLSGSYFTKFVHLDINKSLPFSFSYYELYCLFFMIIVYSFFLWVHIHIVDISLSLRLLCYTLTHFLTFSIEILETCFTKLLIFFCCVFGYCYLSSVVFTLCFFFCYFSRFKCIWFMTLILELAN